MVVRGHGIEIALHRVGVHRRWLVSRGRPAPALTSPERRRRLETYRFALALQGSDGCVGVAGCLRWTCRAPPWPEPVVAASLSDPRLLMPVIDLSQPLRSSRAPPLPCGW